jgi:D-3-phosphoglycerate dehydrogenase / 2-oxoglutarate reductase
MNVGVLDDTYDVVRSLPCFARLREHEVSIWNDHVVDVDVLAARLAHVQVLMLMRERTPISAALLERLPELKLITLNGVTPHIDLAACTRRGVAVTTRPYISTATAELTWALVLMSSRRIPREMASLKRGDWQSAGMANGLNGRLLGVWGYGQIGKQVAQFGRTFGMRVQVWSRPSGLQKAQADGFESAGSKEALFESSDVLSLHVRLAPETHGCVTAADLASMKPDALIVNTSRARLIEDGALVAALRQGHPGMAAVDVFEDEPMRDPAHPLLQMDNVICTPHLGYVERQQYEGMYGDQIDRMEAFFAHRPEGIVNPGNH